MKNSEKVLIGILVVAGAAIGYSELFDDSDNTADKDIVKIPDPVMVPIQEYKAQAVDPEITLPANAQTLVSKEHNLLVAGYDAKIAEHQKTTLLADVDVEKAKAELVLRRKEGETFEIDQSRYERDSSPSQPSTPVVTQEHSPAKVSINTFLPDGRAITTINGVPTTVSEGQSFAGLSIKNIDPVGKKITYVDDGRTKSAFYTAWSGRSHPSVKPMKNTSK
jgi:hypothetical protein